MTKRWTWEKWWEEQTLDGLKLSPANFYKAFHTNEPYTDNLEAALSEARRALEYYADEKSVPGMVDSRGFSEAREALINIKEILDEA